MEKYLMTPSMILLIVSDVLLVAVLIVINRNSIRRDKENADYLKTELMARDRTLTDLKARVDQINSVAARQE